MAAFPQCDEPMVSVVLVAYGTGQILTETLGSIANTIDDTPIEVVVVDNPHPAHPTRSEVELRLFSSGVHVVAPSHNVGFAGGCELGALHARGEYLAFVNPDVTCVEGWLPTLVETASRPDVSIAAPVLLNSDGSVQEAGQRLYSDGTTAPRHDVDDDLFDVDYASAACWVMRRDEHERLGGFDPAYHPAYFEDVDFAVRAQALGGRTVVDPRARVVHHHGSGTPDRPEPAFAQRDILLATWPSIRWTQPRRPA